MKISAMKQHGKKNFDFFSITVCMNDIKRITTIIGSKETLAKNITARASNLRKSLFRSR